MKMVKGAFITSACFCEKILVEEDKINSLIRVFDKYTFGFPTGKPPRGKPVITQAWFFVQIKSQSVVGKQNIIL